MADIRKLNARFCGSGQSHLLKIKNLVSKPGQKIWRPRCYRDKNGHRLIGSGRDVEGVLFEWGIIRIIKHVTNRNGP